MSFVLCLTVNVAVAIEVLGGATSVWMERLEARGLKYELSR